MGAPGSALYQHGREPNRVATSADGTYVASGDWAGDVIAYDIAHARVVANAAHAHTGLVTSGLLLAIWMLACAGSPRPVGRTEGGTTGHVVHADGRPAAGAVVRISTAKTGDELAVVVTGSDGSFHTTATGPLALTATTPDDFAYMLGVSADRGSLQVRLAPDCDRIAGQFELEGSVPRGAILRFSRFSDTVGDTFAAQVASNDTFHACVPRHATYLAQMPDVLVDRRTLVTVPIAQPLVIREALRTRAASPPPSMVGISPEARGAFAAALPASVRVLGLGESNHGAHEFTEERVALAIELARSRGFHIVMIEAGYGETLALDDYINGAAVDAGDAVAQLGYWMWDTKDFLGALDQLRAFNASVSPDHRIHLIGLDVQDTGGAIDYLLHHETAILPAAESSQLERLIDRDAAAWPTFSAADRAAIRSMLGRLAELPGEGGASSPASRTRLAARSLLRRLDDLETTDEWARESVRNHGMAEMVLDVMALEPTGRATLWTHLGHVAREYFVGQPVMGAELSAALGSGYRAYGLLAIGGSARAWDADRKIGVIAHSLRSPPPNSVEAALASRAAGAAVTYWTFATATGEAARWLDGVHPLRDFGALFPHERHDFNYWSLRSIDGVVLFDRITATEPTPTGERRAQP